MAQRTSEWYEARCGLLTASRYSDATARIKSGWGASRFRYMAELTIERLTGKPTQGFQSAAMAYGTEVEPEARDVYEYLFDVKVEEVDFVRHPTLEAGASPDGLVGEDGLVEIKCPESHTHLQTILSDTVSMDYIKQMQWQMICTGRQWCDFISYDNRMPPNLQMYRKRVHRVEPKFVKQMEDDAKDFLDELAKRVEELRSYSLV